MAIVKAKTYTSGDSHNHLRAYKSWIEMDTPVNPPKITKRIKGKENALYNSVSLSPMLDKDKWRWQRYFKGRNRAEVCKQFNQWIRSTIRKVSYPSIRCKPLNEIAFVDDPYDELFYSSDMDLKSDSFSFMSMDAVELVIKSAKGQIEFNHNPHPEMQRFSLKRPKGFDSNPYIKIENNLCQHKRTGYYFVSYGKERYSLLTDDRLRAKGKLEKVLKNLRRKLDPFHHEQNLIQRCKKQELKVLVSRLKRER